MTQTVGHFLINSHIPTQYQIKPGSKAKDIKKSFTVWAKSDPVSYADSITKVKRIADQIATFEGLTVGLEDIAPLTTERNQLMTHYSKKFNSAKTDVARKMVVNDAIQAGTSLVKKSKGMMAEMVISDTKGKPAQLMKNLISPIGAKEYDETPYPFLITKGFSEGLTPGGYWVDSIEQRNMTVAGKTAVAEPGDFGKQMFNALNTMVVTVHDCGTSNGILLESDDSSILDRHLSRSIPGVGAKNAIVTSKMAAVLRKKRIKEVFVRSPISCEARNGVCQMCYGNNVTGNHFDVGSNVGTIAAQSLSEPLTQMKLSSKHGVSVAGASRNDTGMEGVRKLLSKPKIFPDKATLSQLDGKVDRIEKAPQGGHYVFVNNIEHYVPVKNNLLVKKGDSLVPGQSISDGLPDPREITMLKGMGGGRRYFVEAMYNAYNPLDPISKNRTGTPIDKRHLEVLAKKDFNHVLINETNNTFSQGDIVEYNKLKGFMANDIQELPTDDAVGEYLGKEYMYYTVGTQVTPRVATVLKSRGFKKLFVTKNKISYTPYVTNIRQVPMLKKDFIARMTHHEIRNSLMNAASLGEETSFTGYDPTHAFIRGVTFGEGTDGQY